MNLGQTYWSGTWIAAGDARLPLDDLGFLVGATVVERLRTFQGRPFQVERHISRLKHSLRIVGWDAESLGDEVDAAIREFISRNSSLIAPGDDWTIVAFVTPGRTDDASQPTVCVHGGPLEFNNWASRYEAGVKLCVVDVRQVPGNCWPPELKCRSRMHYYLADREAARRCPGARAVLLDQRGYVGEASTANIVCYFENAGLVIPKLQGVLPGISQEFLFQLTDQMGLSHREEDLAPGRMLEADEAFITSTSLCIQPIVEVDGRPIGSGKPGNLYQRLLDAWGDHVGVDIAGQARLLARR